MLRGRRRGGGPFCSLLPLFFLSFFFLVMFSSFDFGIFVFFLSS